MEKFIQPEIKCPFFIETNTVVKNVIAKFQKANSKEKQYYRQDILVELNSFLSCKKFIQGNPDCLNCHAFAKSQKNSPKI